MYKGLSPLCSMLSGPRAKRIYIALARLFWQPYGIIFRSRNPLSNNTFGQYYLTARKAPRNSKSVMRNRVT
jgi:hypothetical protein